MQITPLFGQEPITSSNVTISVNPNDRARAVALVESTKAVAEVTDEDSFAEARQVAAQLKAMLDEIEAARKQAKQPFAAVARSVDQVASDASAPVKKAQDRILGLLAGYVARLELARKQRELLEAQARQEHRQAQEEAIRKINEAREGLKGAVYEEERAKLQNLATQQQLAMELAGDIEDLDEPEEPPRGLVPGGRVNHTYEFELVDVKACVDAGCWRLLRWEIDVLACRDAVKNLVEMLPPDQEVTLPGIKITKKLKVSVQAASRIK